MSSSKHTPCLVMRLYHQSGDTPGIVQHCDFSGVATCRRGGGGWGHLPPKFLVAKMVTRCKDGKDGANDDQARDLNIKSLVTKRRGHVLVPLLHVWVLDLSVNWRGIRLLRSPLDALLVIHLHELYCDFQIFVTMLGL